VELGGERKAADPPSDDPLTRLYLVLPFVMLGLALVARLTDTGEGFAGGGAFAAMIAIFAVQAVLVMPRVRRLPLRHRLALLAILAALTYLPYVLFADDWYAPMGWQLACSVLLMLPARIAWPLFALIVTGEGLLHLLLVPVQGPVPQYADTHIALRLWFQAVTINDALLLYVLVRLRDVAAELDRGRGELARLALARERFSAARSLDAVLGGGLSAVMTNAGRALHLVTDDQGGARTAARQATSAAHRLLDEVRSVARDYDAGRPVMTVGSRPHSTRLPLAVLAAYFLILCVVQLSFLYAYAGVRGWGLLGYELLLVALLLLQLRHTLPPWTGARPSGLWWTIPAQVVLALIPFALLPPSHAGAWVNGIVNLTLLAGSAALLVTGRRGVLLSIGLLSAVSLAFTFAPLGEWPAQSKAVYFLNLLVAYTIGALFVYGPGRLIGLIRHLNVVRQRLARAAVARERERLAQDTHDLLGFGLSTITLKCELAQRLIGTDRGRALRELTEILQLCAAAAHDVRSVTGPPGSLTLEREAAAAKVALTAIGAAVRVELPAARLPGPVETVLATVLREAVTNVLRHSGPSRCEIEADVVGGRARLRVTNDGVVREDGLVAEAPPGRGLANLTCRAEAADGSLSAGPDDDGGFVLLAEIPLTSTGDPALTDT
jgi:signal transduction histidine kinase